MSILDAPIGRLDGSDATLGEITGGRPALLVNVASKCGLTPQYTAPGAAPREYADRGFTVVGVPCNQFGGQEPGSAEEIAEFCSATYGVTFPMTEKVEVNGDGRHPVYAELVDDRRTRRARPATSSGTSRSSWSPRDGTVIARYSPTVVPDDERVVSAIEALVRRLTPPLGLDRSVSVCNQTVSLSTIG